MKAVLISIQPKWCDLIASGEKTIEVRKTRPKIETPFKCYIYETKARSDMPTFVDEDGHVIYTGRGQVIGEFICDKVDCHGWDYNNHGKYSCSDEELQTTCLTREELNEYGEYGKPLFFEHITDLKIYDEPRELREFIKQCPYNGNCQQCEFYSDYSGECRNIVTSPPQSWMYVEELP